MEGEIAFLAVYIAGLVLFYRWELPAVIHRAVRRKGTKALTEKDWVKVAIALGLDEEAASLSQVKVRSGKASSHKGTYLFITGIVASVLILFAVPLPPTMIVALGSTVVITDVVRGALAGSVIFICSAAVLGLPFYQWRLSVETPEGIWDRYTKEVRMK